MIQTLPDPFDLATAKTGHTAKTKKEALSESSSLQQQDSLLAGLLGNMVLDAGMPAPSVKYPRFEN